MEREQWIYSAYVVVFAILMALILVTPLLAFSGNADALYSAFAYTCHQKLSRSLCLFNNASNWWISECTPSGTYVGDISDRTGTRAVVDGVTGYKMPVCARDFGLYAAMLFGALVYPLVRELKEKRVYPVVWLIVAIAPLALDGGLQLLAEIDKAVLGYNILPFEYESTNAMRLLTGAIAGFAASFYAIALLMNMFGAGEGKTGGKKAAGMPIARAPPVQAPTGQTPEGKKGRRLAKGQAG